MTKADQIFMYLLDEGTDCWRPVEAIRVNNDCFKIISVNQDPENENWQFQTGSIVRCEERELSSGKALVAVEQINENPS